MFHLMFHGRFVSAVLATAMLVWQPSTASAQDREGFWLGLGAGYGSTGVSTEDFEDSDREGSGVGYLKAGWTLNDYLLIGGEANLWTKTQKVDDVDGRLNIYQISGTVTVYPARSMGLFLKGGAGAAFMDTDVNVLGSTVSVDLGRGVGALVGAGYDIRIGRRISITPAVNVWYGRMDDIELAGEPIFTDWRHNVVDFTIGITFH